jgi:hypothetical protein
MVGVIVGVEVTFGVLLFVGVTVLVAVFVGVFVGVLVDVVVGVTSIQVPIKVNPDDTGIDPPQNPVKEFSFAQNLADELDVKTSAAALLQFV